MYQDCCCPDQWRELRKGGERDKEKERVCVRRLRECKKVKQEA